MKKFKVVLTSVLAVMLIIGSSAAAFASPAVLNGVSETAKQETPAAEKLLEGEAIVVSPALDNQLLIKIEKQEIALNISDKTIIIDSETGLPALMSGLKAGDKVYVYYSPMMSRSIPAQSAATAIVTNIKENQTIPKLMTVKEITMQDEKQIKILNEKGDLIVTINGDTVLSPFKTKNIVTIKDIKVGTKMFVYYDIVALSYPGQTFAKKAVILENETKSQDDNSAIEKVYVDGKLVDLNNKKIVRQNGKAMVPLRLVSKAMGFELVWDAKEKAANIDNGSVKTSIKLGLDSYYLASSKAIGLTNSMSLGAKPEIAGGTMYVPADLFKLLYSNPEAVKIENGTINFTTK